MVTSNFAEVNGTKFFYETAGAGPALVLVHAGIADGRMWNDQVPVFARNYSVLRYDRRGFGRTPMVAGPYSHHQDLYALLKALKIERACLVGCSQGAKTIVDFTLEHPEMAAALLLVSPSLSGFVFDGKLPKQFAQIDAAEEARDWALINELELQVWVDGPQRTPEQVDPAVRALVLEMNRIALQTPEDLGSEQPLQPAAAGRLDEIHAPTLVITGEVDTPATLASADFLAQHITGAQKAVIQGTAHMPNMEKAVEFNHLVLTFLASLDEETSKE